VVDGREEVLGDLDWVHAHIVAVRAVPGHGV
jgi:hypothetical protein